MIGACLIVVVLHLICRVSLKHCGWLLASLKCLTSISLSIGSRDNIHEDILKEIPMDPRTALVRFDLKPTVKSFICCPDCFALYPILDNPNSKVRKKKKKSADIEEVIKSLEDEEKLISNV